jgi:hypothetical protein
MAKLPMRKILVPRTAGTVKMSQITAAVKQVKAMRLRGELHPALAKVNKADKKKISKGIRLHAAR